ncbi:MAG: penicillin-binding protein 2 [Acidobacteriota bacterium]|nr:penicillin-binding protein 2 [Blastocatellia bacterium]MDW8239763.1 penicillin-binding protein 2 [Acidobacteriota bacterium]
MLETRFLTIMFLISLTVCVGLLLALSWQERARWRSRLTAATTLPREPAAWLRWIGVMACVLYVGLMSMHGYWSFFAAGPLSEDAVFVQQQQRRDVRHRRIEEIGLRGWIFDRAHSVASGLAGYRWDGGSMKRVYMLGQKAVHVVGYSSMLRSRSGIELAYEDRLGSSLSRWQLLPRRTLVGEDVVLTLDQELQSLAADQLAHANKPGAVVIVQVHTGDVLAMASFPTFDPHMIDQDDVWNQLRRDPKKPFLNRALHEYYLPGSTFKVIVAATALAHGWSNPKFVCTAQGYRPPGASKLIYDDRGPAQAHGQIDLGAAMRVSCNQYFAQLGVKLGYQQLAATTEQFGFRRDATPEQARERQFDARLWNDSQAAFSRVFRPNVSRLVLSDQTTAGDLAFQAYGQGFVQVTPLHMALVAAAIAHDGQMMTARLDMQRDPQLLRRVLSAQDARTLQAMMVRVTEPGGTAAGPFAALRAKGIRAAGKTGTAQFMEGSQTRLDSWFIGFAPADQPQIAYAIVVEGGGYGSETAAPIAAALVEAAARKRWLKP